MLSNLNRSALTIEQFIEENAALLKKRMEIKLHPLLTYGPNNKPRRKKKAVFNPAWFPTPQETRPTRRDLVSRGDLHGMIVYIAYEMEEIGVLFFNQGIEAVDLGCFYSHTSRGGKTRWLLDA